jgi:hypothetical protein
MHIGAREITYLNQEKEVGVLACWSSAGALLNVVLGNVYTLLCMRACENSSEAKREDHLTMLSLKSSSLFSSSMAKGADYELCSYTRVRFRSESEILTRAISNFGHG